MKYVLAALVAVGLIGGASMGAERPATKINAAQTQDNNSEDVQRIEAKGQCIKQLGKYALDCTYDAPRPPGRSTSD